MFFGLNWSVLLVFLALAVIGLWVSYSFLNKNGLYLFCVLAAVLGVTAGSASMFSQPIVVLTVVAPVVHFSLLVCLHKYGKEEAKKLFFTTLIALVSLFVCIFFLGAYEDAAIRFTACLTWDFLGTYLTPIITFVTSSALTLYLAGKINVKKLQNFLQLAIFVAIASGIDVVLYTIFVYTGSLAFIDIVFTLLIKIVLVAAISLGLGYFEKFLNREPKKLEEVKEEKPEEPKKEEPAEEVKTPEDID